MLEDSLGCINLLARHTHTLQLKYRRGQTNRSHSTAFIARLCAAARERFRARLAELRLLLRVLLLHLCLLQLLARLLLHELPYVEPALLAILEACRLA
jgi:hypothetical protein